MTAGMPSIIFNYDLFINLSQEMPELMSAEMWREVIENEANASNYACARVIESLVAYQNL